MTIWIVEYLLLLLPAGTGALNAHHLSIWLGFRNIIQHYDIMYLVVGRE